MNEKRAFHIHIEAGESPISINLREVWRYRDLILLFTRRAFKLMYKQTILGPLWIVLSPFFTSIIYTVIFGNMAGLSTNGVPKFLFYLCSHSLWAFFADCLRQNSTTFLTNARIFSKVYFPRLVIPFSTVLTAAVQLLIHLVMVFVLILWNAFRGELSPDWKLIPLLLPVLAMIGMMGLGLGILISSVTTKYRDLTFLVGFGLNLWMYLSPVIYPVSQLSGGLMSRLLMLNPMTAPMELSRLALLGVGTVTAGSVLSTVLFTAAAFLLGVLMFNRVERTFIDNV